MGALLLLAAAACEPREAPVAGAGGATGFDPRPVDARQRLCEASGGRYGQGGAGAAGGGGWVCFRTPRDAGKRCESARDCETQCLARSRSCAPITPLFGCHQVLTDTGAVATQCTD